MFSPSAPWSRPNSVAVAAAAAPVDLRHSNGGADAVRHRAVLDKRVYRAMRDDELECSGAGGARERHSVNGLVGTVGGMGGSCN